MRKIAGLVLSSATWVMAASAAHAGNFSYKTIAYTGKAYTLGASLNDSDQVVGSLADTNQLCAASTPFIWNAGTFTTLSPSKAPDASAGAYGINDKGEVVGYYVVDSCGATAHSFVDRGGSLNKPFGVTGFEALAVSRDSTIAGVFSSPGQISGAIERLGQFTPIPAPSGGVAIAGINKTNAVAGSIEAASGGAVFDGFLFEGGQYTQFAVPGADRTFALSINDAGEIGGLYVRGPNEYGFVRHKNGAFSKYVYPVRGVGVAGQVVGWYNDGSNNHAFNYVGGTYYELNIPGVQQPRVLAISNVGTILGTGFVGKKTVSWIATCAGGPGSCTN